MKDQYTSPAEFSDDFQLAHKNYWNQVDEIDREIERLKKKKDNLFCPRLKDQLRKLAVEIQKELKADDFEISPQGILSNRVSIWFTKEQPSEDDRLSNTVGYLCFCEYNNGEIALVSNLQDDNVIDIKSLTLVELVKFAKENI